MMLNFNQLYFIQTVASFHGFGAVSPDDWFAGSWSASRADDCNSRLFSTHQCTADHAIDPSLRSNINFLELFPVLIEARRWGALWTNKRVCVETDNTQAMSFINKGTCKNLIAMSWLREIFWLGVRHNFDLRARHLPSTRNGLADRLSRLIQSHHFSYEVLPLIRISHATGPSGQARLRRGVCKFDFEHASLTVAYLCTVLRSVQLDTHPRLT